MCFCSDRILFARKIEFLQENCSVHVLGLWQSIHTRRYITWGVFDSPLTPVSILNTDFELATATGRSQWEKGEENLFSCFLTHDLYSYPTVFLISWYWFLHLSKETRKERARETCPAVRTAVAPSLPRRC